MNEIKVFPASAEQITIRPSAGVPVKITLPPIQVITVEGVAGIPGPPGPKGGSGEGGTQLPIAVTQPRQGDILKYNGAAWANKPAAELLDGGNF